MCICWCTLILYKIPALSPVTLMFMLLPHWFLHNAILYYLHHDIIKKSCLAHWDVCRCFKHWHGVRTEVKYKPQRQSICPYHIFFFFILFHEVIRDTFILSKIINTTFNYITDNLKKIWTMRRHHSPNYEQQISVKYIQNIITLVANATLAWQVSAIAFTLCLIFPAIHRMEFKLLSNDPALQTGCAGTSPTCYKYKKKIMLPWQTPKLIQQKEIPRMITWGFPLSAYCSIPLEVRFKHVNQPKALINNKGYQLIITINIHMKEIGRQLKGNIGKYTAWEKRGVGQFTEVCSVTLINHYDVHKSKLKKMYKPYSMFER